MNLNIKNYKNIGNLNLDIDDNKVNFIFGISGSGKTSIGQSIYQTAKEDEVMIGKDISEVKILLNNENVDTEKVNLYNENVINNLIVQNSMNTDMYQIIFSNDMSIMKKKAEFQDLIKELLKFKDELYQYIGKVDVLIKNFGGKLTVKKELSATAKVIKFEKAITNTNNKKYVELIKSNGNNYLKWISEGREFKLYKETKTCPFCEQLVSKSRIQTIEELCNLAPKDFEIIFDNTNILKELNISSPDYSNIDDIEKLKERIISKIKLKEEILNIIDVINYYMIENYNPSDISVINTSNEFEKEFPKVIDTIKDINNKIFDIKKKLGELKQITDKTIHDNLKVLNDYIEKFGIPYRFKLNRYNIEEKLADYILYHVGDKTQKHRINGLSYGEKNIISLLLFLMSNKKDIVIIDDPASSYDDYRRKIIFDIIFHLQNKKTFVVLSHDMVFIKYAVFYRQQGDKPNASAKLKMFYNNTGKIISLENYNELISIKNIDYSDFDTIENQVRNHIKNNKLCYFRKIINLRILTEERKNNDSDYEIIYNYLSAIIHKKEKKVILQELKDKGFEEKNIISKIESKLDIKIEEIPEDILFDFNISQLTDFEKIFYYRDDIKDDIVKDEFNNIIHMNSSYTISLNPYKYNYFSPYVYNNINK